MSCDIETGCISEVKVSPEVEVTSCGLDPITPQATVEVTAEIPHWNIVSDDIYLVQYEGTPPQWFNDTVNNIIEDTGLIDEVADLEDRFGNLEEGYTNIVYDYQQGDKNVLAQVETIYTTNGEFNSGINDIKVAYVSKNESGAYFDSLIGAWQTGAGGAWFNERVSVVSNVAYSAAKSASTLSAAINAQSD